MGSSKVHALAVELCSERKVSRRAAVGGCFDSYITVTSVLRLGVEVRSRDECSVELLTP